MGNDIKVPAFSQCTNIVGASKLEENEEREQISYRIDKVSQEVAAVQNEVESIELNLTKTKYNIEFYQKIIKEMSSLLLETQVNKENEVLSHEKFKEKAKTYLDSLGFDQHLNEDAQCEEISDEALLELETTIATLNHQITKNEESININYLM